MGCQRQASSNPRLETRSCKSNWKVQDEADSCKMMIIMIIMMIITWSSFSHQFLICFSRGRIRWLSDWSNPSAIGPVAKQIVNNCWTTENAKKSQNGHPIWKQLLQKRWINLKIKMLIPHLKRFVIHSIADVQLSHCLKYKMISRQGQYKNMLIKLQWLRPSFAVAWY